MAAVAWAFVAGVIVGVSGVVGLLYLGECCDRWKRERECQ